MARDDAACHNQAVTVEMSQVDLGPCRGRRYAAGGSRWSLILPGAMYLPDAPLLWFAREAVIAAGYDVLAVWDTYDGHGERQSWVDERLAAGLRAVPDQHPLLITKSLSSLAARGAADRGLAAVWLTPLISDEHPDSPAVIAGLRAARAPALLIGGSADFSWDAAAARSVPRPQVLEIAGADHVLQVPGDVDRSLDALRSVATAIRTFAAERLVA